MKETLEQDTRSAVENGPHFSRSQAISKYAECRVFKPWKTCFTGNFIPIIVVAPLPKIPNSVCQNRGTGEEVNH